MAKEEDKRGEAVPHKHKHTVGQDPDKIEEIIARNRRVATPFVLNKCEANAAKHWNLFYKHHEDRFFKNKNWTEKEFEVLGGAQKRQDEIGKDGAEVKQSGDEEAIAGDAIVEEETAGRGSVLLEVGCGPGNMLYPIIKRNRDIKAHACDFSSRAVEILASNPAFDPDRINAFVHDLVSTPGKELRAQLSQHPFGPPTVVSLIFVLSAIPPQHHRSVLQSLADCLPDEGGALCFRDFARGDLTQLRFHQKASAAWAEPALLSEEQAFYRRGDNTFTYFFDVEELRQHAEVVGLEGEVSVRESHRTNRKTGVHLHRRFVHAKWRKKRTTA
ncbi:S-adenosyl-L-methionine-dependent methyltransferase [Acaromyces ingoldii]|uniref:tRNA N(3)-methylcytidine methyltransferase n=1 Tax=Acaromyces ingoldii TaxID=215250 RepID=A0A316YVU4_9BASI|nr:S-adenosyl-L-methionine-dependent methyltransferase [Acaromyces ingoldii]PWN91885.1 S-adenosyl-L-methionine-dependent methyltransferase [Acaromyces ingoldii]